jgi:hypothetical protein
VTETGVFRTRPVYSSTVVCGSDPDLIFTDGFESGDLSAWATSP